MSARVFLLTAAFLLAFAGTAAAAPVRAALSGDALAEFDAATQLYKDGRFEEARAKFQAAYDASKERRLLFNVAVCDKALGHNARAIHELEDSLADRSKLPSEYVDRAQQALAALREHVSQLTIDTSVPGAALKVDGEDQKTQPVLVDEGAHVVTATLDGYQPATEKVTAQGGQPSRIALVLVPLAPKTAHLKVATDRQDDTIAIDDRPRGLGPIDAELEPGEHQIVITRPGGGSKKVAVVLKEGETRDMRLSVPEEKKGVSPWWFVVGGAIVAGAATTVIIIATRPTKFEGSNQGTLNPYIVTAGYRGELR